MFFVVSKVFWFFAAPSNLFPILVLAGLALAVWSRARRFGIGLAALAAMLNLAAGLSPLPNLAILPLEQRFPAYRDDGQPIAGIVVLGGTLEPRESVARDQLLVNEAAERVVAMADLARSHPEARIVFSGGSGALVAKELPESDVLKRYAATLGIAPERILFENASRNTYENAVESRRLLDPKPGERWLLVTSAFHMPRSVGCFRQAGFAVTAYPVDFRTGGPPAAGETFEATSRGLRRLDMAVREWIGLVAYRFAGYTDALFPGP